MKSQKPQKLRNTHRVAQGKAKTPTPTPSRQGTAAFTPAGEDCGHLSRSSGQVALHGRCPLHKTSLPASPPPQHGLRSSGSSRPPRRRGDQGSLARGALRGAPCQRRPDPSYDSAAPPNPSVRRRRPLPPPLAGREAAAGYHCWPAPRSSARDRRSRAELRRLDLEETPRRGAPARRARFRRILVEDLQRPRERPRATSARTRSKSPRRRHRQGFARQLTPAAAAGGAGGRGWG
ncbi:hypothetical protein QYE76_046108 [Lolium multiflorum]|uniref:Uncharacterized protein n=1 Tax=Lolium multiflorum TaxID=4521 RepID=A0AAD8WYC9_LOLMU|nr:hypothetical protein QYE76_046108 [Lolium multiflorum]